MADSELKQLLNSLQQAKTNLSSLRIAEEIKKELDNIIAHAQEPIWIMVMGEFSSGKSTFINALVGQKVARMDATPTTAVITKLCYGAVDRIVVYFCDGTSREYEQDEFDALTAETEDEEINDMHKEIDYVERRLPIEILRWVTIIDSPGLNVIKPEHIEATNRFVNQADTVIWMASADQVGTGQEVAEIEKLSSRLKPIVVVNKMDLLDEDEDDPDEFVDNIRRIFGERVQAVVGLSAKLALQGKLKNDENALADSNLAELDHTIRTLVVPNYDKYKMNSLLDELSVYCYKAFCKLDEQKKELQRNPKTEDALWQKEKAVFRETEEAFGELGIVLQAICKPHVEKNNPQACFILAILKYYGIGAVMDKQEAVALLEYAVSQNNTIAQICLAGIYREMEEWEKSASWYLKLAKQNHAIAQFELGWCSEKGIGCPQNDTEAIDWYTKAAQQGYTQAQYRLALCCYRVLHDYRQAVLWCEKAAESGHEKAQNVLSVMQYSLAANLLKENTAEGDRQAFELLTQAAEQGNADAQEWLGICYEEGRGVSADYQKAFYWYTKATEQNKAIAQNRLGMCYHKGIGVEQNYQTAVSWYQKAAEQNSANAQFNLGWCYCYGEGVPKDVDAAICWFDKAAKQGHAAAQGQLEKIRAEQKAAEEQVKPVETSSAEAPKKNWTKLVGIVGVVLLALVFLWHSMEGAREAREHQSYQDGIQSVCSDIMDMNHIMAQALIVYQKPELRGEAIGQLSRMQDLESIKNKYNSLIPTKGMEGVHKNVGDILKQEEDLRQVLVKICEDPVIGVEKNLKAVAEHINAIKSIEKSVPMFDRADNLDEINSEVRKAIRSGIFIRREILSLLYDIGDECEEIDRKINIRDTDSIAKGKKSYDLQLTKYKQLKVPSDTEYVSVHLEEAINARIKLCDRLLQAKRDEENGYYDEGKALKELKAIAISAQDTFERYQTNYVRYEGLMDEADGIL